MNNYRSIDKISDGFRKIFLPSKSEAEASSRPAKATNSTVDAATYTVDEAVEHFGCGPFQLRIIAVSAILTAADAMEMMLLAALGPALRCDWRLSPSQVALLTTFVFIGMFAGAPAWGAVADKCGRKPVLAVSAALIGYFGLLCSGAPDYAWVVILRCLVGFNIGGGAQCYTLLTEFLPNGRRVLAMVGNIFCWGIGGTLEILLAWAVLPWLGWRAMAAFTAAPMFVALPLLAAAPESLRYLLASGHDSDAARVMEQMARDNSQPPLKGRLVSSVTSQAERGHVKQLFRSSMLRTTLTLFPMWLGVAFTYYGVVLLSSDVASFKRRCSPGDLPAIADVSCCRRLGTDDFRAMLLCSLGEFVIQPLNLVLLDWLGRRITMAVLFAAEAICVGLVCACIPQWATIMLLFLARGCASALFICCIVYTTEVYPTTIRSLGLGLNSAVARIGSMLTPLVAQVLLPEVSVSLAFSVYVALNLVCCALALSLPIETRGRALQQELAAETGSTMTAAGDNDQISAAKTE